MPENSLWKSLTDMLPTIPGLGVHRPSITEVLAALPKTSTSESFSEAVARRGNELEIQRQIANTMRAQDAVGLQQTLGPANLLPAVGMAQTAIALPPLAVGVGQDIGNAIKSVDPKNLAMSLLSLPILAGMAAQTPKPTYTREQSTALFERISPHIKWLEKYAEKVADDFHLSDSAFNYENLLAATAAAPADADLRALLATVVKRDLRAKVRKEAGEEIVTLGGARSVTSLDALENPNLQAKEQITYQSPYDKLKMDLEARSKMTPEQLKKHKMAWEQFDLSDPQETLNFKKDVLSELGNVAHAPQKTLSAINRQVAEELMREQLALRNKYLDKTKNTTEPRLSINIKLRDRIQKLLDMYFTPEARPDKLKKNFLRDHETAYKPEALDFLTQPQAKQLVLKADIPYKSDVMLQSAVEKYAKNTVNSMTGDELMALLDAGIRRTAAKVQQLADKKRARKNPKIYN